MVRPTYRQISSEMGLLPCAMLRKAELLATAENWHVPENCSGHLETCSMKKAGSFLYGLKQHDPLRGTGVTEHR